MGQFEARVNVAAPATSRKQPLCGLCACRPAVLLLNLCCTSFPPLQAPAPRRSPWPWPSTPARASCPASVRRAHGQELWLFRGHCWLENHSNCVVAGCSSCHVVTSNTAFALPAQPPNSLIHCLLADERSLGFWALGYGRASGRPAVVITSSGTAVANLLPAVVEVRLRVVAVPSLAKGSLTAPPELAPMMHAGCSSPCTQRCSTDVLLPPPPPCYPHTGQPERRAAATGDRRPAG